VGEPERRRLLEAPNLKRENIIRMYLREKGLRGADSIYLAQDGDKRRTPVNSIMDLQIA
jgi:hypothetical protein